jgi:hypothetical protein
MITVSHLVELLLATPASFAALRRILLHIIASFTATEILLQGDVLWLGEQQVLKMARQ